MNSSLYDKEIEFPSDKRRHMKICFDKAVGADANINFVIFVEVNGVLAIYVQKIIDLYKQEVVDTVK